ncbi:MAG: 7-cyano-7-deazaguanine synthase QueC [Campylobacterota bacterium]
MKKQSVCIISGGMDSAVSAHMAKKEGFEIIGLHFNYGQRTQDKEKACFHKLCDDLNASRRYDLDLDFFSQIGASSLIDTSMDIPTDGLDEEVPSTYVPFRNGIFLSIAAAVAEKHGAEAIHIGVVAEDSSGYPDCTDNFIKAQQSAINIGTKEATQIEIHMPLVSMSKKLIVQKAKALGVNLGHTWSCYQNSDKACGVCDSCRLRLRGFNQAAEHDPVAYEKPSV